jgi:hypothetical protein
LRVWGAGYVEMNRGYRVCEERLLDVNSSTDLRSFFPQAS